MDSLHYEFGGQVGKRDGETPATDALTADLTAIVFALSFSTTAYIFNCSLPW